MVFMMAEEVGKSMGLNSAGMYVHSSLHVDS